MERARSSFCIDVSVIFGVEGALVAEFVGLCRKLSSVEGVCGREKRVSIITLIISINIERSKGYIRPNRSA